MMYRYKAGSLGIFRSVRHTLIVLLSVVAGLVSSCRKENLDPLTYPEAAVDIRELVLECKDLALVKDFWVNRMGMELLAQNATSFSVRIGTSKLKFVRHPGNASPFYHFAVNIPENQIEQAFEWIRERAQVIRQDGTGAEIIHKPLFNAHSLFFHDPAGNVVELTARHVLTNTLEGTFTKNMLLKISEVSIITKNTRECAELMTAQLGVREFERSTTGYKPIGGAEGILAFVVTGKTFLPSENLVSFAHKMEVVLKYPEPFSLTLPGSACMITTQP